MSTLNVANISDGTDTVETGYVVNGSAKAWVNFNGNGTIAVRDSLNVASLTDNGTGDFSANFNSSYSNTNYVVSMSAANTIASSDTFANAYSFATGSVTVGVNNVTGALTDRTYTNITTIGDLA
jgi:hypothetical protein